MEMSGYFHAPVAFRAGAGASSAHSIGGKVGLCCGLSCVQVNASVPGILCSKWELLRGQTSKCKYNFNI